MCRNHSHLVADRLVTLSADDGLIVGLGQVDQDLTVESSSGLRWIVPCGATLLIVVPSLASASSLPNRVTAALAELLSTDSEPPPAPSGTIPLRPLSPRSPSYSKN